MKTMAITPEQTYWNSFSRARCHFERRYFSGKRIARNAAVIFGLGLLASWNLGPQIVVGIPLLLDWFYVSRERKNVDPDKLLGDLVRSCLPINSREIVEGLVSCNRVGHRKMAAEFLAKLREVDKTKFEEVLGILGSFKDKRAKRILREFSNLDGIPTAYRSSLEKARWYFAYASLSAKRIVRNAAFALALVNYTPIDDIFPGVDIHSAPFTFLAGTLGFYLGGALIADAIGVYRMKKRANPNQLLDGLVNSSLEVDARTIARDLASYNRRGLKEMGKDYLLRLKEACETKFNRVVAFLQESRRGRSLAAAFVEEVRTVGVG